MDSKLSLKTPCTIIEYTNEMAYLFRYKSLYFKKLRLKGKITYYVLPSLCIV